MPDRAHEYPKRTIAAIDIGTNSAHMVVAEMDHIGEMRILDTDKVNLRLGQALDETGNITEDGINRAVQTLSHMRQIADSYRAGVRAVATHATREAVNHKKLLTRIEKEAGVRVEIIDGIEEARLVFLGMRYGLALNGVPCLGVDVGGGSTEIILAQDDDIKYVSSFKLGAVTLTDKHFGKKAPTAESLRELREHVRSRLAPLPQEARLIPFQRALASSGTAKALAYMHAKLVGGIEVSDPNGYTLSREELGKLTAKLTELLTPGKIKEWAGLDTARAEIILAGATVLDEVSRLLRVREWVVTSFGLREGLVADSFYRAYGRDSSDLPDIQWHSVQQFGRRLGINETHALQVRRLSQRLFAQLAPTLLPNDKGDDYEEDIKLLSAAAYLREAGKFLSSPQYHKHSDYLISNARLPGFTETERSIRGLIARFQRKSVPSADNRYCAELAPADIARLRFLSGIVRLAAALDRTRQGKISDVVAEEIERGHLRFTLVHDEGWAPEVELHRARMEIGALEKCFDRRVSFA
jgi:exopolyphosphatase/guanosine-5'-triphosphate,3'-diphosphate pyrophosphatase